MVRKLVLLSLGLLAVPQAASAATIVIMTDPMGLDRRTFVIDTPGPDRVLMCAAPPAIAGCRQIAGPR